MSKIDVLHFLEQVVRQNTQHYQSDFDYDRRTLTQAAQAVDMADRVFCWMSRPAGTWCVKEREVFLRGKSQREVAATLGVTSQSVYCSKKAALDTLRRAFGLRQEGLR